MKVIIFKKSSFEKTSFQNAFNENEILFFCVQGGCGAVGSHCPSVPVAEGVSTGSGATGSLNALASGQVNFRLREMKQGEGLRACAVR